MTIQSIAPLAYNPPAQREGTSQYLAGLKEKYPSVSFLIGEKTGSGALNIAISQSLMRKLEADPSLREKYDSLIEGFVRTMEQREGVFGDKGKSVAGQGVILYEDGTASAWSKVSTKGMDVNKLLTAIEKTKQNQSQRLSASELLDQMKQKLADEDTSDIDPFDRVVPEEKSSDDEGLPEKQLDMRV